MPIADDGTLPSILRWADAGVRVEKIAADCNLTIGYIYRILRQHRPDRPRSARRRVSNLPAKIAALAAVGTKPARVAELLGVSRQYVYRWWPQKMR